MNTATFPGYNISCYTATATPPLYCHSHIAIGHAWHIWHAHPYHTATPPLPCHIACYTATPPLPCHIACYTATPPLPCHIAYCLLYCHTPIALPHYLLYCHTPIALPHIALPALLPHPHCPTTHCIACSTATPPIALPHIALPALLPHPSGSSFLVRSAPIFYLTLPHN